MAGRQMAQDEFESLKAEMAGRLLDLKYLEDAQRPLGDGSVVPYFPYPEVNMESAWKNAMAAQVAALREDVAKLREELASRGAS